MDTVTTTTQVLAWAAGAGAWTAPATRPVPPPAGSLRATTRLLRPDGELRTALGTLTRDTAARLGAGRPPFGDDGPVGAGPLLLAAAIGARHDPARAGDLIGVAPRLPAGVPGRWVDAIARHGVVEPVLRVGRRIRPGDRNAGPPSAAADRPATSERLEPDFIDTLLAATPLSAVLYRPPRRRVAQRTVGAEVATAFDLIGRPRGARVLTAALAAWAPEADVLAWRADLLSRLSGPHPDVVVAVYLLARQRHGGDWDRMLAGADRRLRTGHPDDLAIATISFWAPLARLHRRDPALLRRQETLAGVRPALSLVDRYRLASTAGEALS